MSKPSYEVQKRYRDKAIRRVVIDLPKEMSEEWENHLNASPVVFGHRGLYLRVWRLSREPEARRIIVI